MLPAQGPREKDERKYERPSIYFQNRVIFLLTNASKSGSIKIQHNEKGPFSMALNEQMKKWYFKLERDLDLDMPMAWSGFVRCNGKIADARKAVAKKLFAKRLPPNTIVMSEEDFIAGKEPKRVTNKKNQVSKQYAKSVKDVGPSFDEVQDMLANLKKQGLL